MNNKILKFLTKFKVSNTNTNTPNYYLPAYIILYILIMKIYIINVMILLYLINKSNLDILVKLCPTISFLSEVEILMIIFFLIIPFTYHSILKLIKKNKNK